MKNIITKHGYSTPGLLTVNEVKIVAKSVPFQDDMLDICTCNVFVQLWMCRLHSKNTVCSWKNVHVTVPARHFKLSSDIKSQHLTNTGGCSWTQNNFRDKLFMRPSMIPANIVHYIEILLKPAYSSMVKHFQEKFVQFCCSFSFRWTTIYGHHLCGHFVMIFVNWTSILGSFSAVLVSLSLADDSTVEECTYD